MPTELIDADEAMSRLISAVEFRGEDFVYPDEWLEGVWGNCRNFVNGDPDEPACIVGLAFADVLDGREGRAYFALASVANKNARDIASAAQGVQDRKENWGAALAAAERVYTIPIIPYKPTSPEDY